MYSGQRNGAGPAVRRRPGTQENKANELDRLASLDYTRFDDTAANEVMADKTATNKLPAAQKAFAPEFRFDDNGINIRLGLQFTVN